MNSNHKIIEVPIFKADIYYSRSSWQDMIKWLNSVYKSGFDVKEYGKSIELDYADGTTGRVFVVFDNTGMSVSYWFWSAEIVSEDVGYCGWIAHECMHLVTEILRQVETPLLAETEEIYAYLLEFIVTEILKEDYKFIPKEDS